MDESHCQEAHLHPENRRGTYGRAVAGDGEVAEGEYWADQWLFVLWTNWEERFGVDPGSDAGKPNEPGGVYLNERAMVWKPVSRSLEVLTIATLLRPKHLALGQHLLGLPFSVMAPCVS